MSVAPKRPKGPPLNAMRAFEAAARNVSFVAAADELNVTPGAISQHIKALEHWAGTPLFRRNAQGVELTQAGQSLVAEFTAAFDSLANATRALRGLRPNAEFHIAALPSVAQLWLPKRLNKIREHFPTITFSVTAMETAPSLSRELFDLAIFFDVPDGSADQIPLCPDEIAPVCAPSLVRRFEGQDIWAEIPLLHDQTWFDDWQQWSKAAGLALDNIHSGPQFSLYSLAVEEAKAGAGALIGHLNLIEDALNDGSLIQMHDTSSTTARALLVQLPSKSQRRTETDAIAHLLKV